MRLSVLKMEVVKRYTNVGLSQYGGLKAEPHGSSLRAVQASGEGQGVLWAMRSRLCDLRRVGLGLDGAIGWGAATCCGGLGKRGASEASTGLWGREVVRPHHPFARCTMHALDSALPASPSSPRSRVWRHLQWELWGLYPPTVVLPYVTTA